MTAGNPSYHEIAVSSGDAWNVVASGRTIPDHHITRMLAFLGSGAEQDLVHTAYAGGGTGLFDEMRGIVERLVLVGTDGAGRRLRRRRFDATADELIRDVDAIYLLERPSGADTLRFIVLDIRAGDDESPGGYQGVLVCKREDFSRVHRELAMGGSGGALWRGTAIEDSDPILAIAERDYTFAPALLRQLRTEVVDFLRGEVADRLREWDVPAKRGIVLFGDPGNGKTVLTRICAKHALEAGMNVVIIEGRRRSRLSYDRGSMGLGDELRRAAARAPALLLFEDIDLHCEGRTQSQAQPHVLGPDSQQPLAELLDFLDGVEPNHGYVLLASTNHLESLDRALRRPGRIDVEIEIANPNREQRGAALQRMLWAGPRPAPDPGIAAELLGGASFADLAEVVRRYKIAAASAADGEPGRLLEEEAKVFIRERDLSFGVDDAPTTP